MSLTQIAIAVDQLMNTLVGGYADETLSSRAYRLSLKGKQLPMKLINHLFFWQVNHCLESYQSEVKRNQLPPEFRVK